MRTGKGEILEEVEVNIYENIVILDANLPDEEVEEAIAKIKGVITDNGGEVLNVQIWGKRKLAYEIKKHKRGLYMHFMYKAPSSTIRRLEEFYKVFDPLVKHMVIKISTKRAEQLEKMGAVSVPGEQKGETSDVQ